MQLNPGMGRKILFIYILAAGLLGTIACPTADATTVYSNANASGFAFCGGGSIQDLGFVNVLPENAVTAFTFASAGSQFGGGIAGFTIFSDPSHTNIIQAGSLGGFDFGFPGGGVTNFTVFTPGFLPSGYWQISLNSVCSPTVSTASYVGITIDQEPSPPSLVSLGQFAAGTTPMAQGGVTTSTTISFTASIQASTTTDPLQIQIEVQPSANGFTKSPTAVVSSSVGQTVTVSIPNFSVGSYHWAARVFDPLTHAASAWQPFSTSTIDFVVASPLVQTSSTVLSDPVSIFSAGDGSVGGCCPNFVMPPSPMFYHAPAPFTIQSIVVDDTDLSLNNHAGVGNVRAKLSDTAGNPIANSINTIYGESGCTGCSFTFSGEQVPQDFQLSLIVEDGIQGDGFFTLKNLRFVLDPPILSIVTTKLAFGNVPVGKSLDLIVEVTNPGGSVLTGTAAVGSPFTIVNTDPISVPPGGSQALTVNFAPMIAEQYLGSLSLITNGGDTDVPLQGIGVQPQNFVTGQITRVVSSASVPLPDVPVVRLDKALNFQEMSFTDANGTYFLTNFAEKDYVVPVSSGADATADDPSLGVHGYIFSLPSRPDISAFCQIGVPTTNRKCEGTKENPVGNFTAFPKPQQGNSSIMLHMPLPAGAWRVTVEAGGFAVTGFPIDADPSHTDASSGFYALDFAGSCGTPILAAADGDVSFAGANDSFGRTVVIAHSAGLFSRYAHLDSIPHREVHVGAHIRQGDVVGYMGNSGLDVGGAHLHFQIYNGDFQPSNSQSADLLLPTVRVETETGSLAFTDFIAGKSYQSTNGAIDSAPCSH